MKYSLMILGCITTACILSPGISLGDNLDPTPYCPSTTTDADGDGWGWENGQSCIVIRTAGDPVLCPIVLDVTDPDDDGWGWTEQVGSCLVDNTSITPDFRITNASGADITNTDYPINNSYVKSFGTFTFDVLVAADGTLFQYRVPDATLAATDNTGKTLWVQKRNNYMILQALSDDDTVIYAYVYDSESYLAAIDAGNGEIIQRIVDSEGIGELFFGSEAIIAVHQEDKSEPITAVTSLNYDGTVRWKFGEGLALNMVYLGKDGKVYIKDQSGLHGNEQTLILEQ